MPRKTKDCGCGGGKHCLTKKGRGRLPGVLDTPQYKEAMALYSQVKQTDPATAKQVLNELKTIIVRKEANMMKGGCLSCGGLKGGAFKVCPEGFTDLGLLCSRYRPIDTSRLPWTGGDYETIEKIDHAQTQADIRRGFEEAFSANGPLARAFDPEKNGVAESFRKFGADSVKAFEFLGETIIKNFDPNQNGVKDAFQKLGEELSVLGDDDWWRETMSDPDTYIFLIGTIASVAAMFVTGGLAGAALGALGPALNMINSAAKGEPVDPLDIAGLALSLVPAGAAALKNASSGTKVLSSAIPATELAFMNSIKATTQAAEAVDKSTRLARLGKTLANGVKAAASGAYSAAKGAVVSKVMNYVGAVDELVQLGKQTAYILKNPSAIAKALQLSPQMAAGTRFIPWSQLSKLGKAQRAAKAGVMVLKKGVEVTRLGVKVAKNGEVIGLWNVPDDVRGHILVVEKTASLADKFGDATLAGVEGRVVDLATNATDIAKDVGEFPDVNEPLETVDLEKAPAEVVVVETDGSFPAEPPSGISVTVNGQEQEFMTGLTSFNGGPAPAPATPTMSPEEARFREEQAVRDEAKRQGIARMIADQETADRLRNEDAVIMETEMDSQTGIFDPTTVVGAFIRTYNGWRPSDFVQVPEQNWAWMAGASMEGLRRDLPAALTNQKEILGPARFQLYTSPQAETMLKEALGGAGRPRFSSLSTAKMSGAGNEALAYMGTDMSPLEGGRVPNRSFEQFYDREQADNHAKKVALVRRRAEQRTVKIKPYTERPVLLSDTFKVNAGRDIHGQVAGGGAYRGAFTRGEPQAGEEEVKFYYPAFSGREVRGEVSAGTEYAGPQRLPMGASLQATPTLSQVATF